MVECAIHVCMNACMRPLRYLAGESLILCKSEHFKLWVEILGYTWEMVLAHIVVIIVMRFMSLVILFLDDVLVVLTDQLMRKTVIAKYIQLIKVKQFY